MIRSTLCKLNPFACLVAIIAMVPLSVLAQDSAKSRIVGAWNATAETDEGERNSVWTIKRDGDGYSGESVSSESGERSELSNISFDGKELGFEIEVDYQGQALLIKMVSKIDGNKIDGQWTAMMDGNELATGVVSATKKVMVRFRGNWNTTATLPDGTELKSVLTLKGKNDDLSGSLNGADGDTTEMESITVKGKSLRMEFVTEIEGSERDLVIEATMESGKSLDGQWIMLSDSGDELASGDWMAKRAKTAKPDAVAGFDGTSLDSFRGYGEEAVGSGWEMTDGVLHLDGTRTGDIMTKQEFGNFELRFEWKISEGGNSGVMYRVSLGDKKPYLSGPEYQVLDDDKHKDGKLETHRSGSLYALYPPKNKTLKPVGQWNTSKIVLNGNTVEHWLNGQKVVEAELGSDDWKAKVAASKFKNWVKFGKNKKGHICFQDHGDEVWYRNIKIAPLD